MFVMLVLEGGGEGEPGNERGYSFILNFDGWPPLRVLSDLLFVMMREK